jgi:hypothetical protein
MSIGVIATLSFSYTLKFGVPQGFTLGSMLFNISINFMVLRKVRT